MSDAMTDDSQARDSQVEVDMVFWCKIDNVRVVATVLNTLLNKKSDYQIAYVEITKFVTHTHALMILMTTHTHKHARMGMKFTIEEGRSLQGNAYLISELFQEYNFLGSDELSGPMAAAAAAPAEPGDGRTQTPQRYCFRINFTVMMECLAMFASSTSYTALQIAYGGYGSALFLLLEEGNLSTRCSIRTLDNAEHLPSLSLTDAVAELILESDLLKDAFAELDWSSTSAALLLSPTAPFFRLSTEGLPGTCEVEYPMNTQLFRKFRCRRAITARYKMAALQPTVKALAIAQLTQLQVSDGGILKMQHMIRAEEKTSFVDFTLLPEVPAADDSAADDDAPASAAAAAAAAAGGGDGGVVVIGSGAAGTRDRPDFVAQAAALMHDELLRASQVSSTGDRSSESSAPIISGTGS